jgi:uncharacterized membrane protein
MKRFLSPAVVLVFALGAAPAARAIEIERFDVSIVLDPDATFVVTETIAVDFGELQKHGIFRTIPVAYSRFETVAGVAVSTRYSIRLRVSDVRDGSNVALPYTARREGANLFLRIGDPDRTVTGKLTYVITYRVERAINEFESHDELYWNVTGTEWDWPIHAASVRVTLPEGTPTDRIQRATFSGPFGSTTTSATETLDASGYRAEVRALGPGEGLTIVLGLPKGVLSPPSAWTEFWWKARDNAGFFLAALAPILAFGAMLFLYLRSGRDPGHLLPIVVQYEPPPDLSPAEVGSLLDERIDTPDIVSTVIDLAVRGYLKIHEEETTRLLFLTSKDYRFEKLKPADAALSLHEATFFSALFGSSDSVHLSSLKNKFYRSIPSIRRAITQEMLNKGLFPRDPERVRGFFRGLGVAVVLAPIVLGSFLASSSLVQSIIPPDPASFFFFAVICLILAMLIIWLFANVMPAKTPRGAQLARHSLGFREFVTRVEKDRIERMAKEDPTLFERVLPYAVVLGVADEWAERFEGLLTEPPAWYTSSSFSRGSFYPRAMVSNLGQSMHAMGSTMTSQPRESRGGGAGGGRSGFGGGGRSGGGFGGGGGGSW